MTQTKLSKTMNNKSIIITVKDLMVLTDRSYVTCVKYRQELLAKGGLGKKEKLTIGHFCILTNTPYVEVREMLYPKS